MVDRSLYKVGVVVSCQNTGEKGQKPMKVCLVNIGDEGNPLTVVTSATNVREGSR
jgi:tRNA-binding EMAP/Myf-like protein